MRDRFTLVVTCLVLLVFLAPGLAQDRVGAPPQKQGLPKAVPIAAGLAGFPLLFVENRGRYSSAVRYHVEHEAGVILFKDSEVVFRVRGREDITLEFTGSGSASCARAERRSPTLVHYLVGSEDAWRTDVPTYRRIRYASLWRGIDLIVLGEPSGIKYEFHVAPGADPERIRMRHKGARLSLGALDCLEIRDGVGLRRTDPAPRSFQVVGGNKKVVKSDFAIRAGVEDEVGFSIGVFDRSRSLVIDPAFLAYSGYLPPAMGPYDVAVDANGAAVIVGTYFSILGDYDACILRVRPDGTGFDFVTHIGSQKGTDFALGVAVDASGIYVGGHTNSDESSFPVRVGPDLSFNNKGQVFLDSFVCKLAHDGKTIVYCGYVGGSGNDGIREGAVAVDAKGAMWFAGQTWSQDYPVRGGPQLKMPGPFPAIVTKVAPDGKSIALSGYLGGGSRHTQYCSGIAVDSKGDAYVVGTTGSDEKTFPVKVGPLTKWQGGMDAFVAKINGQTGALVYCGYIGGAFDDYVRSLAVDSQGAAYVTGGTYSDHHSFPVVNGPVLKVTNTGRGDGFVAKVKPSGLGFEYAGFMGGVLGRGIAVDAKGRSYIGGNTLGKPQIPVGGALSAVIPGPASQLCGFLLRLSGDGKSVEYGGYLGGSAADSIDTVAMDSRGVVYVAGPTWSGGTFPLSVGPSLKYNTTPNSTNGTFIAKVAESRIVPAGTGRIGTKISFSLLANDDAGLLYFAGTSFGKGPIPLGSRSLGLSSDPLLAVSTTGAWPTIFQGYTGVIGSSGTASAEIRIPSQVGLVGLRLHTAFVTLDPKYSQGIKSISDTATLTVAK